MDEDSEGGRIFYWILTVIGMLILAIVVEIAIIVIACGITEVVRKYFTE
jgi:hypothetical protein